MVLIGFLMGVFLVLLLLLLVLCLSLLFCIIEIMVHLGITLKNESGDTMSFSQEGSKMVIQSKVGHGGLPTDAVRKANDKTVEEKGAE